MTPPVHGARASCLDLDPVPGLPQERAPTPGDCDYEPPTCSAGVAERLREPGLRFCREADSVVEGFLCDEPTVVSNACRKPGNAFDAYVCDEPRLHALQKRVLAETFTILKNLLLEILRR
jgi:hypothetical protein